MTEWRITNTVPKPKQGNWYTISNKAAAVADVYLFDEIGEWGTSAADFVNELKEITASAVTVHISSAGGSVLDGIAIFNALRQHPATVTTVVESLAASIASVIAQAGDVRQIVSHARMMIHNAHGIAIGDADDMRQLADLLDRETRNIASIYAERSGDSNKTEHFLALMRNETWLSDAETVAQGLTDEVIDPAAKTVENKTPTLTPVESLDWVTIFDEAYNADDIEWS